MITPARIFDARDASGASVERKIHRAAVIRDLRQSAGLTSVVMDDGRRRLSVPLHHAVGHVSTFALERVVELGRAYVAKVLESAMADEDRFLARAALGDVLLEAFHCPQCGFVGMHDGLPLYSVEPVKPPRPPP